MCGIAGIIGKADENAIRRMTAALVHRGPNAEGVWLSEGGKFDARRWQRKEAGGAEFGTEEHRASSTAIPVSLGFRRLSILDLSEAANQPMLSRDGRFILTFNGEIYNFRELRKELEASFPFRSTGDTEVLLHAYEKWGDDCVHRLRGMFAFAVWDRKRQRLFAAVDRMGIKPFVHATWNGGLVFASEIRALLASGLVSPKIQAEGLWSYLAFGTSSWPQTMLDGVSRLPPGHSLTWQDGKVEVVPWWRLPEGGADAPMKDRKEAVARIRELLLEAVRQHVVADVPLGAFLSGGLDSSALVGLMRKAGISRIKTFSIGFRDQIRASSGARDESYEAFCAAKHYQTEHHEWIVQPLFLKDAFPSYQAALDHPSVDGLNTFLVSQMTAKHVKVVLSGLGGDELWGGYPHLRAAWLASSNSRMIQMAVWMAGGMGSGNPQRAMRRLGYSHWTMAHAMTRLPRAGWYRHARELFSAKERFELLGHADPFSLMGAAPALSTDVAGDILPHMRAAEIQGYLANTLLRDSDVMSMSQSLELRVPFLDHKLVELVHGLPSSWFFRFGTLKSLLSDAVADVVPEWIRHRRKAYFNLPLGSWVRKTLQPELEDALSPETVRQRGVFHPETVTAWKKDFLETGAYAHKVWMLAVFEWWARNLERQTGCRIEPPG